MHKRITLILISLIMLPATIGCAAVQASSNKDDPQAARQSSTQTAAALKLNLPTHTPFIPSTNTPTPPATETPTFTATSEPTATQVMIQLPAGTVVAPILLYHHIATNPTSSRYYVEPDMFARQMQWLYDHGYKTISVTTLINTIKNGGLLPERPVVITFDDGWQDVFVNAFPVMQKFGFYGVSYLITSRIGGSGVVTADQVRQLLQSGWEIGSHSRTHPNLDEHHELISDEMNGSRTYLETTFTVPVNTLSYPLRQSG